MKAEFFWVKRKILGLLSLYSHSTSLVTGLSHGSVGHGMEEEGDWR